MVRKLGSYFINILICGVLFVLLLPVRANAKNLEPVVTSAEWGATSSAFTVQFYEAGRCQNVLAAVYVGDQMYGAGFLELKTGSEYSGTIFHKQLTEEKTGSLKLFFVEEESFTPTRTEYQESVMIEFEPEQEMEPAAETVLHVACGPVTNVFSPFFPETESDQSVAAMTQTALLNADREGNMVLNGIDGETRSYNGTDYTYYGIANCSVTENEDGTVDYDFSLRDDLCFSDGVPVTADDVIFSMYVLSDPTYNGPSGFGNLPVVGMAEYRSGIAVLMNLLMEAGRDNRDFKWWTEVEQKAFWADLDQAGTKFCQEIVDYCMAAGYGHDVASAAAAWGYDWLEADATAADFFAAMLEVYGNDLLELSYVETVGPSLFSLMEQYDAWLMGIKIGESAPSIQGIQRTGDYSLRVTLSQVDVTAIYQLAVPIAPLHHYGDVSMYNYEENQFGFPKGNLTRVRAREDVPLGAGPYVYKGMVDDTVFFEANTRYFGGKPEIQTVCFREYGEENPVDGIVNGTFDISEPEYYADEIAAIKEYNSNDQVTGNNLTTVTLNVRGYGYIGINADTVRVGTDSASMESKLLRKALATILAAHREPAIEEYYGECAHVIQYPISDSSWAAPRREDPGYSLAYSRDLYGDIVVTEDQSQAQRVEAAKNAAAAMLLSAGYMQDEAGRFLAQQENGLATSWKAIVQGNGVGDQPCYGILTSAKVTLQEMGLDLEIVDVQDSNALWDALNDGSVQLWVAAWGETQDPDLHQVYHSSNVVGLPDSSCSNHYRIRDPKLDQLIMDARSTTDQTARKSMYKQCLDIILDWGVTVPVYQRQDCVVFSSHRIDTDTIPADCTPYYGWMAEIHKLKLRSGT